MAKSLRQFTVVKAQVRRKAGVDINADIRIVGGGESTSATTLTGPENTITKAGKYDIGEVPSTILIANSLTREAGSLLIIKDRTGQANSMDKKIIINTEIDGESSGELLAPFSWIQLQSDGNNWGVVG